MPSPSASAARHDLTRPGRARAGAGGRCTISSTLRSARPSSTGRLAPGSRLPATRSLAADLGVGRNTVLSAYDQLHAEGYLDGRVGSGSFVSAELPVPSPRRRTGPRPSTGPAARLRRQRREPVPASGRVRAASWPRR